MTTPRSIGALVDEIKRTHQARAGLLRSENGERPARTGTMAKVTLTLSKGAAANLAALGACLSRAESRGLRLVLMRAATASVGDGERLSWARVRWRGDDLGSGAWILTQFAALAAAGSVSLVVESLADPAG